MGALVVVSTFVVGSRTSTQLADEKLGEHTYKNIAREASVTGMNMTLRRLVADTSSWAEHTASYVFTDRPYQDAEFTTRVFGGYGATQVVGRCVIDTVDVVSTSVSRGGRTHEIRATYVRTCSDPDGAPPFFKFVTISDRDLQLASSPEIRSTNPNINADIHTNQFLQVSAHPVVEGFGSYTGGYQCAGNACNGFDPNVNPAGFGEDNVVQSSNIELPMIVPADYAQYATYTSPGSVGNLSGVTFDFTNFVPPGGGPPITGYGTEEKPFIWYVPGDFDIKKKGTVRTLGHGIIVVDGNVHINSQSNLYSSVPDGMTPPSGDVETVRNWFGQYHTEGTTLAVYAAGSIHNNGKNLVMAQLYANGSVHINGHSDLFGAIVTRDELKLNGSDVNIWYAGANSSMGLPGLQINLPEGIRMIAYSEW
jgi:hypothetical protein